MTAARPSTPSERHVPVMLEEVIAALSVTAEKTYIDGTFGAGGYSRALLEQTDCSVLAIDRDPDAIAAGQRMLGTYPGRLSLHLGRFGDMDRIAADTGHPTVAGVTLDLGISSMQIDQAERGFSFRYDGPLDMRMERAGPSAADLVNDTPEAELADIIWRYGEERRSRRIAKAIVAARTIAPIKTTGALADIVRRAIGRSDDGIDPATRTFQALRIFVNDELGEVERGLRAAERILEPGGRLAVVAFHSLEDRVVKEFLRRRSGEAPRASRHVPEDHAAPEASFRLVTRRPATPSSGEVAANPRARSARLRTAERTEADAWRDAE